MKLAKKLSLLLILGVLIVLAGFGYIRWQREVALFDGDMRRDHRLVGRALAVSLAEVWEDEGEDAARALLGRADANRADIKIRWVSLEPTPPAHLRPALDRARLEPLSRGEPVQIIASGASGGTVQAPGARLFTYVEAPVPGHRAGAVEIAETLTAERAYVYESLRNTALATLLLAVLCGALVMAIGVHFVGRPVARLIEKARRVGAGDFGEPLVLTQKDELGELACELNLMSAQLAEAKRRSEAETEARVAMLEQLRHAERLTTVGRLASALAHEIGTPLGVMAGHAQMIARERISGPVVTDSGKVIAQQCERVAKIVRQILDYARRRPVKTLTADLRDVLTATVDLLGPLAAARDVCFEIDVETDGAANVDAGQIQQALTNLIVNAVHASERGSKVELSLARTTAAPPGADSGAQREYYVLSVVDHGCGIPVVDREKLFEPFFTTKLAGEGTGLGLSIAQDIATEHAGWIGVESEVGHGSKFDLYLPVPPRTDHERSGESPSERPAAA